MATDTGATLRTGLRPYFEANRRVLVESDEITLSILNTFLGVALWGYDRSQREPLTIQELSARIGLPYTTVSRHLRYLGEGERLRGKVGPKLVDTAIYPLNRRQKTAFLTPRGRALAEQLRYLMDREAPDPDIPTG